MRTRRLTGVPKILSAAGVLMSIAVAIYYLFHITIPGVVIEDIGIYAIVIGLLMPFVFFHYPFTKKSSFTAVPWYDYLLALLIFIGPFWVFINAHTIRVEGWSFRGPPIAIALGVTTWILVLEGMRRTTGWMLTIITLLFSIYPLFAESLPGIFLGKTYSLSRTTSFHFLGFESMWGLPAGAFAKLFIGFIVFGSALANTGGGTFFLNLALATLGRLRGGAAKASIVASGLFGMLSGSSFANTITTGTITIPAMKNSGYPDYYAAGIEATASSGGLIMPPIMTFTAFIMADFVGTSYAEVCIAGAIPAVLYFVALFAQSDFYAAKAGLRGMPGEQLPSLWETVKAGWFYIFVLLALLYFLFFMYLEGRAPFWAVLILFILTNFRKDTRLNAKRIGDFFQGSGELLSMLAVVIAGVGMLIGGAILTGLAHSFAGSIARMAGGNLYVLLVLSASITYVLGMGITLTPIYIFLAILIAPALINMGVYPLAAHLFLLYWAKVAEISPPVALTSLVASGIGGASYMKTSFQSVRLGIVSLIMPFFFVLDPALVAHGKLLEILLASLGALVGVLALSAGLEGYFFMLKRFPAVMRLFFLASGGLMLVPSYDFKALGVGILIMAVAVCMALKRHRATKEG